MFLQLEIMTEWGLLQFYHKTEMFFQMYSAFFLIMNILCFYLKVLLTLLKIKLSNNGKRNRKRIENYWW